MGNGRDMRRILIVVLITLVSAALIDLISAETCCKHCKGGKPCGDSCISKDAHCSQPHGCACGSCCKICSSGQPCGDTCISKGATCTKGHGCACWGDGKEL